MPKQVLKNVWMAVSLFRMLQRLGRRRLGVLRCQSSMVTGGRSRLMYLKILQCFTGAVLLNKAVVWDSWVNTSNQGP